MMIDSDLLSILCCPENHTDLNMCSPEELARLNKAIAAGSVKNRGGQLVKEAVDGLLIRADKVYGYIIRQDIPIMLIDEAIPLAGNL